MGASSLAGAKYLEKGFKIPLERFRNEQGTPHREKLDDG
jgi:hypothetical protein